MIWRIRNYSMDLKAQNLVRLFGEIMLYQHSNLLLITHNLQEFPNDHLVPSLMCSPQGSVLKDLGEDQLFGAPILDKPWRWLWERISWFLLDNFLFACGMGSLCAPNLADLDRQTDCVICHYSFPSPFTLLLLHPLKVQLIGHMDVS